MKIVVSITLLALLPAIAFAVENNPKQYRIDAQIYTGDKLISSPRIVTLDGSNAEIVQINDDKSSSLRLQVTPNSITSSEVSDAITLYVLLERKIGKLILRNSSTVETSAGKELSFSSESESSQGPLKVVLKAVAL